MKNYQDKLLYRHDVEDKQQRSLIPEKYPSYAHA